MKITNFKRFLLVAIAAIMVFSLFACGETPDETENTSKEEIEEPVESSDKTPTDSEEIESPVNTESSEIADTETPETAESESDESASETDDVTETIESNETTDTETETETEGKKIDNVTAISPIENSIVVLANDEIYKWWESYHPRTSQTPIKHADAYYPNPVKFEWSVKGEASYYLLYISVNKDMSDPMGYVLTESSKSVENLFVGTTYYWQVDAVCADKTLRSEVFTFKTADSPRAVKIEGVSNTRDAGGMLTEDGHRVKQGMIYRGGKLEDITESGKYQFLYGLGIKTDLDLRTPGEGGAGSGSPVSDDLNYVNINGRYYVGSMGIQSDEGKQAFADEIRLFADPDNYPIYIHCSLGRDRTGTLVMVLQALLGVEKNTLLMDYELSLFSVTGTLDNASLEAVRNNISTTYEYIRSNYKGSTFAEKTENYLLSIGITAEEIQTIRDLMLEEVK